MSGVVWHSTSSPFILSRPINMKNDTDYPGFVFANRYIDGLTLKLHKYHNVEILWYDYGVLVLDANGDVISELCKRYGNVPPLDELRSASPRKLPGISASISHWPSRNYCHTICAQIPLLQALSESGHLEEIDFILCDQWSLRFLDDARAIYSSRGEGVGITSPGHVRCDTLLAFEPIEHPAHWVHEVMRRFFVNVRDASQPAPAHRRLFVTRPKGRRGFENQFELLESLNGFEYIEMESDRDIFDQARLFAEAEIVVCGHGAALTNAVFMRPGTGVVEIFNQSYGTPAFWSLAGGMDIGYCATIDSRGMSPYREAGKFEEIRADIDSVKACVEILERRK